MNTYQYIIDKYKINVGKQHILQIPGMDSINLAELFGELNFKVGVELGVAKGEYSEILCKANPELHLYSIDPWSTKAYLGGTNETTSDMFDSCYKEAAKRLEPYNCTIIRKTSADALDDFEDNSLDFVYIDANHDFPNFTFDLHYWMEKVREDGIISGHDFINLSYGTYNHVKRVLTAYTRSYRMIPFFVCGTSRRGTRLRRDKYHSWFWVKKKGGLR